MTANDNNEHDHEKHEEQETIAREIGEEITDAFVGYVRGEISFDSLVFGVFDALSDLNVVASGDYDLEETDEHDHDDA